MVWLPPAAPADSPHAMPPLPPSLRCGLAASPSSRRPARPPPAGWPPSPPRSSTRPVSRSSRSAAALPPASPAPPASALDALADSIVRAGKPVIVAGLETGADDAKWLRALAESVPAPVLTTPKGKGALPDPHPLALGLLAAGHPLLAQSDLLVVVGVDPVEVSPGVWPAGVSTVRVGRAPHDDAVIGEIALVIEELAP